MFSKYNTILTHDFANFAQRVMLILVNSLVLFLIN